jgi:CBS domain-containing protein
METIKDLLASKGSTVWSIEKNITVLQAVKLMIERKIGAVVVTEQNKIIGIFTERDLMRRVVGEERDPKSTLIADVMTAGVTCGTAQTPIHEARTTMVNRRLRHLPIQDEQGHLVGIISVTDLNAFQVGKISQEFRGKLQDRRPKG